MASKLKKPIHGKTRITLYLDNDILDYYRTWGNKVKQGYQTLINKDLSEKIREKRDGSAKRIRRLIREELQKVLAPKNSKEKSHANEPNA